MALHSPLNPLGLPTISEPVMEDRPCPRCSYNLKGLQTGGRCPECGTPIKSRKRFISGDSVNECPVSFLEALRWGALCFLVSGPVMVAGMAWFIVEASTGSSSGLPGKGVNMHWAAAVTTLGAIGWAFATFLVHTARPGALSEARVNANSDHPSPADSRWRTLNRASQCLWLFGLLMWWTAASMSARFSATANQGPSILPTVFAYTGMFAFIAACIGLVSVCFYVSGLCDWSGDSELGDRFRSAPAWALIGGVPSGICFGNVANYMIGMGKIGPISSVSGLILLGLTLYFTKGLVLTWFSFGNLTKWALTNRNTSLDVQQRLSARIVQRIEDNKKDSAKGKGARGIHV